MLLSPAIFVGLWVSSILMSIAFFFFFAEFEHLYPFCFLAEYKTE